jgi:dephospho-CoA kinase
MKKRIMLCLVAPSGAGKTTAFNILSEKFQECGLTVKCLKLAKPLYALQEMIYRECGIERIGERQNHGLLESFASKMREINPNSIIENFTKRLSDCDEDAVINDDLRDTAVDYPVMRSIGFKFVKVLTSEEVRAARLNLRNDLKVLVNSQLDKPLSKILGDYVVLNDGDLSAFKSQLYGVAEDLLALKNC